MRLKEIDEYYNDQIKFLHPYLKYEDFKKIMEHGFLVFNDLNKRGADVSIKTWRHVAYCGHLFYNLDKWKDYMYTKHRIKLRLTYNYTLQEYDGLYYFGLDDEEYKLVQKYKYTKLKTPFRNIRLYKIKEECFLKKSKTHFFKVYRPFDTGFCVLEEKLNTNNYKEIAYRDSNGKIVLINE